MATSVVGSVVFLKIAEFARRSASEQARLRAQLEAVIAVVTAEVPPPSRLVLEAADGMAIVLLDDPQAALRVGTKALNAGAAGLPLAAGINHGALQLSGRKGGEGMTGDGIAVAANIADFAESSRLFASRAFCEALAEAAPGREALLRPAGTFKDAGLRSHEVFAPDSYGLVRRRRRYGAVALVLTIALAAGGMTWRAHTGRPPFVEMVVAKYTYLHGLVQRARN